MSIGGSRPGLHEPPLRLRHTAAEAFPSARAMRLTSTTTEPGIGAGANPKIDVNTGTAPST